MIYFQFEKQINDVKHNDNIFVIFIVKLLSHILPMANPDFDGKYDDVKTWLIEYDEVEDYTNREVGKDLAGKVIVKAPYKRNLGFWVDSDMTMDSYTNQMRIRYIDKCDFEKAWSETNSTEALVL